MTGGDADRPFLGVGRSLTGKVWRARPHSGRSAELISQRADLPEILGRVLAARDVDPETAESFLAPSLRELMPDPSTLQDMDAAAERVGHAVRAGERIAIIGDYDVDGITSSTLLLNHLSALGVTADVHIPNRLTEGYGPGRAAIDALRERGAELLITVDCGIRAHDPLEHAAGLGLDVVVVDHHQAGETLPRAVSVVDPNRLDDLSGQGHLAAVGVTFLLVVAVNRWLRERGWFEAGGTEEPDPMSWLDLVALGTICDVVPLKGLNRAYVTQGLKVMSRRDNPGIACLSDVARLGRRLDSHALAFLLGPRINAAGRLGRSGLAVELLRATETGSARQAAQALEELNRQRQEIEIRLFDEALVQAEKSLGEKASLPIIIVAGDDWHQGVLGLIASRLKERLSRPTVVISFDAQARGTGSGRSIAGVDLGAAVASALDAGILEKGGGHAMAVGLTVCKDKLGELRAYMEDMLRESTAEVQSASFLNVDGALSASGATLELIDLLENAGPYGAGNPHPVFAFSAHRVVYAAIAGSDHVRCQLLASDGCKLKAMAFRSIGTELGEMLLSERQLPLHIAGRLTVDDWGGTRSPRLLIDDIAVPAIPAG